MKTQAEKGKEKASASSANTPCCEASVAPNSSIVDNRQKSIQQQAKDSFPKKPSAGSPLQMKTKIEHRTADFTYAVGHTDKVGASMRAWLDPHDPVVGSSTGSPQKALYDAVQASASASMVRGHLLNHDLGGYGVAENLYPITSSANSKHKYFVENPVQQELNNARTDSETHGDNEGKGIFYSVVVGNLKTNTTDLISNKVQFICTAKKLTDVGPGAVGSEGSTLFNTTIESDTEGAKSADRGKAFKTGHSDQAPEMKVTRKIVPHGWEHGSRSGKQDITTKISGGKISISDLEEESGGSSSNQDSTLTDRALSAVDDANAAIIECRQAAREANRVMAITMQKGIDSEDIMDLLEVQQYLRSYRFANQATMKINTGNFDGVEELIELAEYVMDETEYMIEMAGAIEGTINKKLKYGWD